METPAASGESQKFSRYRSVRRAASKDDYAPPVPAPPPIPGSQQAPITKVPSRYRRPAQLATDELSAHGAGPTGTRRLRAQTIQQEHPAPYNGPKDERQTGAAIEQNQGTRPSDAKPINQGSPHTFSEHTSSSNSRRRKNAAATPERSLTHHKSYDAAREEARMILEGEYDRIAKIKEQQNKERKLRAEAELARQRAEQEEQQRLERARLEQVAAEKSRLEQEYAENTPMQSTQVVEQSQPKRTRKWTIGAGTSRVTSNDEEQQAPPPPAYPQASIEIPARSTTRYRKREDTRSPPTAVGSQTDSAPASVNGAGSSTSQTKLPDVSKSKTEKRRSPPVKAAPVTMTAANGPPTVNKMDMYTGSSAGNSGPQAKYDAPVSAVNAGERRVDVMHDGFTINLPVTPTTTVRDLLNSASIVLSQPIDPRTAVLMESFGQLGLERPLRRYERVRDTMNSWDNDKQNHFVILKSSEVEAVGLELQDVPASQPPITMQYLYHSQKPGKWDKRWLVLREDGQVTASKKENDMNATNIFHLSDFDIYMPTRKQLKRLRPPKKICFAIKSQQKLQMFESTENFVHVFSTSEKSIADGWYNAVQSWRSWYLVNVLGEGQKSPNPNASATQTGKGQTLPAGRPSVSRNRDSIPYQLGTFQSLLEISADDFKYDPYIDPPRNSEEAYERSHGHKRTNTLVQELHSRKLSGSHSNSPQRKATVRNKDRPPVSYPRRPLVDDTRNKDENLNGTEADKFGPILGGTDAGFTGGGLLARAYSTRRPNQEESSTVPENTSLAFTGKGLLGRNMTKKRTERQPGKPLVDMSGNSTFVDGSLLRQVEAYNISQGGGGPLIDRARHEEVEHKVGEGF